MLEFIDSLSQENWTAIIIAIICGGMIGLERQLRGKAAGMRTSILICLSTLTFVQLGLLATSEQADPTRVLGQIITGVGFLGAGVIMTRGGTLAGVTSASIVWILAAVGAAIGFERYAHAFVISIVTIAVLTGINMLETNIPGLRKELTSESEARRK